MLLLLLAAPLADSLKPFVEAGELAGAVVLVASAEKILALETVGYSDLGAKTPLKDDALFWIASQSKPITAAAVMLLVDDKKLSLDDPLEKHLPEYKDLWVATEKGKNATVFARPRVKPTIRHALAHTTGLPFASAAERPTLDKLSLKDASLSYARTPLQWEPGTKYQYSNAGINAAGRVVEVVSGMPFEDFLDKRLFAPLGMKDTTFWPKGEQLARLAKGYRPGKDGKLVETKVAQLRYPLDDRKRGPMPAGGLFSTARDVSAFCRLLLNKGVHEGKRVLSEEAVAEMVKKQTGELKEGYGLGLSLGGGSYGHGGAWSTNMSVDTKSGLVFVWLVQHAGFAGKGGAAQGAARAAMKQFGPKK